MHTHMRPQALVVFLFLMLVPFAAGADKDLAGTYNGEWSGASGASGKVHLELQKTSEGEWKCVVSFTMDGEEYKTKMKSVKVDGAKLEARYEWELQGTVVQSTITGELSGKTLEGKYRTVTVSDGSPVDEGVWKASS